MSKVITFSRYFPVGHPRKGQETFFVERILHTLRELIQCEFKNPEYISVIKQQNPKFNKEDIITAWSALSERATGKKGHTIRAGKRFKAGEKFSPRYWQGKPYNSKQVIIAPDVEIVKTWDFDIIPEPGSDHAKVFITDPDTGEAKQVNHLLTEIARHDGLTLEDFLSWFKFPKAFSGQIICWDKSIKY